MGVTGLWTVVQPCARPIKLETLNKKRLAVDASIWIYQFLKAVRDKEGNALRNSHVVGFFRRICKLLFFGIKPIFVFDGGAPALKRQTIAGRKKRREGRREDAVRTAGKLLALQMQRRAEEEEAKRKDTREEPEEELPEDLVYVDELQMTAKERQQNRQFKKKDAYHLPDLDVSLAEMGAPNDPRIMSHEELEEYARQFHSEEDINLYDFSKIDFNSPFFLSLPASDRYNILNAARLRSRLRMGYSKDQLDSMFPDRMAFSRFQIERVRERNDLTQRLMNLNGMNGEEGGFGLSSGGRIAGEKGKEYVLVKNDGVEGGWALGVVSNKDEGQRSKPIDVEGYGQRPKSEADDDEWEDEAGGFEDVPIEGLNRLPKRPKDARETLNYDNDYHAREIAEKRRAVYESRQKVASRKENVTDNPPIDDPESLFVADTSKSAATDALFEDDDMVDVQSDEDDELRRAIQMSLEVPEDDLGRHEVATVNGGGFISDSGFRFDKESTRDGRAFAHDTNARANRATFNGSQPNEQDREDEMDLQTALAESRKSKYQLTDKPANSVLEEHADSVFREPSNTNKSASSTSGPSHLFNGPLPFESLNLGTSLFQKKKSKPAANDQAGGFERQDAVNSQKPSRVVPPWFADESRKEKFISPDKHTEPIDVGVGSNARFDKGNILKRQETGEVIDVDDATSLNPDIIHVESSDEETHKTAHRSKGPQGSPEVSMGDVADLARAEPPRPELQTKSSEAGAEEDLAEVSKETASEAEEIYDWEPTDEEDNNDQARRLHDFDPAGDSLQTHQSKSSSPEFENTEVNVSSNVADLPHTELVEDDNGIFDRTPDFDIGNAPTDDLIKEEEDFYSDPEDEDLMRQLAIEAEEHARFASSLNSKSQAENAFDYERELKQLRSQQKKDRRDADEVSHIMVTECQQLLRLFGLPYITAPMEAEAQCAELISLGLVDGIVTDDSDIFLFGGTRVYKNMFNQGKFVECYLNNDLEKEYALDRRKLIQFAHLLGSDYTEGIPGVGPVTALEILTEFGTLEDFRNWWSQVQMGATLPEDVHSAFRKKFKRNAAKLFLPPAFPDTRVDIAYLEPEVDSDPSPFQWGVPDLDSLRSFLMATIGWSQERTDEVLVPVIKDMNRRENEGTQANITSFFGGAQGAGAFAPRRRADGSGRMEKAFGRLRHEAEKRNASAGENGASNDIAEDDDVSKDAATKSRRKRDKGKKARPTQPVSVSSGDSGSSDHEAPKKVSKKRRKVTKAR